MKVENNFIGLYKNKVIYNSTEYPIEVFSKNKIIMSIADNIDNLKQKKKFLNFCWNYYLPIAHYKASKHHRGCRYAVKQRDSRNRDYGIYKKILNTIKTLQIELGFDMRGEKYD